MKALFLKEIRSFFGSTIGYTIWIIYLVLMSLFLWVFPGEFNILDAGFATLDAFFLLAPWVMLLLIPALTMRSFSEELQTGTFHLLQSRPLLLHHIVLAKYAAYLALVLLCFVPTLIYLYTVVNLGFPKGNIDLGVISTSYIGLFLLSATYVAIGLFCSSLTKYQLNSLLLTILLCFFWYVGFDFTANLLSLSQGEYLSQLGIEYHYISLSRGLLDMSDLIYFLGTIGFFLLITGYSIQQNTSA